GSGARRCIHDESDEVIILYLTTHDRQQEGFQSACGRLEPWRVDEDDLRARKILDARDPVARRLGARRDDRELLAHQAVQERRLARIRTADQRDEPRAGHCSGAREAGAIGGWPETRRDPAPLRMSR